MATKKKTYRRYSDEERANAVAAVVANGSNISKTAKQLGIPAKTLEQWVKSQRREESAKMSEQKKGPLADRFQALAEKLVGIADQKAESLNAKDAVIAAGVAVDKARLLRNEPTNINEHRRAVTDRIEQLADAFEAAADRAGESAVPSDDSRKPVDSGVDQGRPLQQAG